jgi:hypothetical protein
MHDTEKPWVRPWISIVIGWRNRVHLRARCRLT